MTGLDFSVPAIEAARAIAAEIEVDAEFVAADVYAAVEALGGPRFDIIYTNVGALNWLPDIPRWAEVGRANDYVHHRDDYDDPGSYADLTAPTVHNRTESGTTRSARP